VLPAAHDAAASSCGITHAAANPAIVKKVKKVVDTRLDAPELAVALQQLSEFYGECNVVECARPRSSLGHIPRVQRGERAVTLFCLLVLPVTRGFLLSRKQYAREPTKSAINDRATERRRE